MGLSTIGAIGLQAGGNLLTSGINALFGSSAARKTRKHQKWLAMYQNQKNIEMWNRQNEYNTPAAQMQRYKDAGLNPNLIYGQGNSGNATAIPEYQAYDPSYHQAQVEPMNMIGMLSQFQDFKNKKVVHDNLNVQTKLLEKDLALKEVKRLLDTEKTFLTMSQRSDLDNTIGLKIKKLEAEAKNEWMRYNINQKDWERYRDTGLSPNTPWQGKLIEDLFRKYIKKYISK